MVESSEVCSCGCILYGRDLLVNELICGLGLVWVVPMGEYLTSDVNRSCRVDFVWYVSSMEGLQVR